MCHISPVQPFQLWEVVEEVCGVVAQGTEGVGPMGGVREGELLKVMEREEGGHILREGGEGGEGDECSNPTTVQNPSKCNFSVSLRVCECALGGSGLGPVAGRYTSTGLTSNSSILLAEMLST